VREGIVDSSASACAIVTGNGLKDIQTGIRAAGEPVTIPPDITLLERELARVAPSVLA